MKPDRFRALLGAARLPAPEAAVTITGDDPVLATAFAIGEAAATALALAAAAAADLHRLRTGVEQEVTVDVRGAAASLVSFALQRLDGVPTPRTNADHPLVAFYECGSGGWIHLHGGFPALAAGTADVLGLRTDDGLTPEVVRAAAARWDATDLEDALAAAGQCGARARTSEEWLAHAQGLALSPLAVVEIEKIGEADPPPLAPGTTPLDGVRVLDLTRVLAGPTCGRTLACHGADVLRVGSPLLPSIPPFVLDTGHGKRSCFVDLDDDGGRAVLDRLVAEGDVFSCGYRAGALDRRGFGPDDLAERHPGTVYVSINAYGHRGPWQARPGWEQLAQAATGVAITHGSVEAPQLLPAAATDYTTGYLGAYGAMVALARRQVEGGSWHVRVSLAQTAMWLQRVGADLDASAATGPGDIDRLMVESVTPSGVLTHLGPVAQLSATPPRWTCPSVPLGTHPPEWLPRTIA